MGIECYSKIIHTKVLFTYILRIQKNVVPEQRLLNLIINKCCTTKIKLFLFCGQNKNARKRQVFSRKKTFESGATPALTYAHLNTIEFLIYLVTDVTLFLCLYQYTIIIIIVLVPFV